MVTTASAPVTASAADTARVQPASAARASASSLRSKARTSCPAFARFAAIPPPMFPSPMKAIFIVSLHKPSPFQGRGLGEGGRAFPSPTPARRYAPSLHILSPEGERRSEEHTSELQSLMRISYAVFCLK